MTTMLVEIPLARLVSSAANVRKTGRDARIDELAASIAAHGLLQNLTVRPVGGDEEGASRFEVVAGGRRLAALKLLVKEKRLPKSFAVPCKVVAVEDGEEVSLAENITQAPMHPADQYEAFARLVEAGRGVEAIAARFGVSATVVRQRMKLGAVSRKLMALYREGEVSLDQLMAFAVTDDHAAQERVWAELGWNKSKDAIRRALTTAHVPAGDRCVRLVGVEAYEAAGGVVVRDLFDETSGGWLADVALLDRLVRTRLDEEGARVRAEGWKWVEVDPEYPHALAAGLLRLYPRTLEASEETATRIAELEVEKARFAEISDGELSDEVEAAWQRIEDEITALQPQPEFAAEDRSIAGAFVSLGWDGAVRIERGFVRAEDEPVIVTAEAEEEGEGAPGTAHESESAGASNGENEEPDDASALAMLSDKLTAELSAHRTLALRDALTEAPRIALRAVVHALAARTFFRYVSGTALEIEPKTVGLVGHAPSIGDTPTERRIAARHGAWASRLPTDVNDLWSFVMGLDETAVLDLLAHCAGLTVNALRLPWDRRPSALTHADGLAEALGLDMTRFWEATAESYFSRVTKGRIVEAVEEGAGRAAAERIIGLKKTEMAAEAERLLRPIGWLPPMLRTKGHPVVTPVEVEVNSPADAATDAFVSEERAEDLTIAAE